MISSWRGTAGCTRFRQYTIRWATSASVSTAYARTRRVTESPLIICLRARGGIRARSSAATTSSWRSRTVDGGSRSSVSTSSFSTGTSSSRQTRLRRSRYASELSGGDGGGRVSRRRVASVDGAGPHEAVWARALVWRANGTRHAVRHADLEGVACAEWPGRGRHVSPQHAKALGHRPLVLHDVRASGVPHRHVGPPRLPASRRWPALRRRDHSYRASVAGRCDSTRRL